MYPKDNISLILRLAKEAIKENNKQYEESPKWQEALKILSEETEHSGLLTFHFYWEKENISVMIGQNFPKNYGELLKFHPRIEKVKKIKKY